MCYYKSFFVNFLGLLFFNFLHSQNNKKIDSLEVEISKKQEVSSLINNYNLLTREYLKSNIQKSIEYNKKAEQLLKKDVLDKNKGNFYRNKATIEIMTEKPELCINDSKMAAKIYLKIKDTTGYLNTIYDHAYALAYLYKFDESIQLAKNALKLSKSYKFCTQSAKLNHVLCINYTNLHDTKNALYHIKKSIYFYRKSNLDNNLVILNCYNEISNIYLSTQQFTKALEYANMGIKLKGLNYLSNNQISVSYTLISNIYTELKNYENALLNIQIAIKKSKNPYNKLLVAKNLNLQAIIYLKQKKYDLSIEYVKKAIAVSEVNMFETDGYQILGNCYFAKSQIKKASDYQEIGSNLIENESKGYLKKAYELQKKVLNSFENSNNKEINKTAYSSIYEEIAKTENALGNYKNAYEYSLEHKKINDKIWNDEKTNRINELQTSFEVSEKEIALKNSLFEKQKKDIEIQKQNNQIFLISSVLILTVILIFFLVKIYFNNKRKNTLLLSKNLIIEKTNSELNQSKTKLENLLLEKDVLLKEIHHRVKNNLQIIISLLNIQSRSCKNISTDEFIEKSLARITSMSLVHQNLYQNENVDKVDFNEYLQNLTQSITNSFLELDKRIKVDIVCQDIFLQIETAIPLGLIINELMYNMYKHAFPEYMNGVIEINIKKENNYYLLNVKDNGIGFNEDKDTSKSMGLKLVNLLSNQIDGTFEKVKSEKTEFLIQFTETSLTT